MKNPLHSGWATGLLCLFLMSSGCQNTPGVFTSAFWGRLNPMKVADTDADDSSVKKIAGSKKMKNPERVYLAYGQLQEQEGHLTEARDAYDTVLAENPRSIDALMGLARLEKQAGNDVAAEEQFQNIVKMAPRDARVHFAVGQYYTQEKQYSKAAEHFEEATRLKPVEPLYRYNLGLAIGRGGDLRAAFPEFARSVGEAEAHYNVGYLLYERKQYDAAEQQFQEALRKKPELKQAQEMMASLEQIRNPEGTQLASHSKTKTAQQAGQNFQIRQATEQTTRRSPFDRANLQRTLPNQRTGQSAGSQRNSQTEQWPN